MNQREVQNYIQKRFPGYVAMSKAAMSCRNSHIFKLDLCKGKSQERIIVKVARNHAPGELALEFANLSLFYHASKPKSICSPRPMIIEEDKGLLAMSYVPGVNLAHMLHEVKPVSQTYLGQAIDLCSKALAAYHTIFQHKGVGSISVDRAAPENDINNFLSQSCTLIVGCRLKSMVTPFFDFTLWNIIISSAPEGGMRIFLIDFPRKAYISTPHLDLARFRFSLELIKQFPPAKFFGINRWEIGSIFDRLL